jgi:hypothetical protein
MGNGLMKFFDIDAKNATGIGTASGGYVPPLGPPDLPPVNKFQMPKTGPGNAFTLQRSTNNPQSTSHAYLQKFG